MLQPIKECNRGACVDVTIIDDCVLENDEIFSISLARTPRLPASIEYVNVSTEVTIMEKVIAGKC